MSSENATFVLHTYFRSSCSARIRIALNLKELPYESVYVNLLSGQQSGSEYAKINPSRLVPTLQHVSAGAPGDSTDNTVSISQSMAILEYLDEAFPDKPSLLPPASDPVGRATVRALANIIACDTQPVTNLRILLRVTKLGGSKEDWARELMSDGFAAYERLAAGTSGRFSYGDRITLADVCLVPDVWGALRFGVELDDFPVVKRVYEEISKEEAVGAAYWQNQGDTPVEHRR